MHPAKIEFESCDLNTINKIINKETQTNKVIVISDSNTSLPITKPPTLKTPPSRTPSLNTPRSRTPTLKTPPSRTPPLKTPPTNTPTPPGNDNPDKDSLTVFEFCQILQNPESPKSFTLIKESISQEIHKHPAKKASDDGVANRYKYCREVIEPYLKPYPPGCPQSQETLLKDVLESVHQDFPDYQPCIDNYLTEQPIDSKTSSLSKVDAVTSYDSKPSKVKMDSCDRKKSQPATTVEQRPGCFTKEADTASGLPDPGCDVKKSNKTEKPPCIPKKKSVPRVCESTCEAECAAKKKPPKRAQANECPPPIDYCKKRSEESIGKKKKSASELFGITQPVPPVRKSSVTEKKYDQSDKQEISPTESACEKLSQIKTAMEDFVSKVYTTTQETVNIIKTESARQFDSFTKSSCNESESDNKSERSRYGVFGKVDSKTKDDVVCEGRSAGAMLENLVGKVDSAVSKISDKMDINKLPEAMKPKSYNDSSSKYDVPTPPKEIAHIIVQTSITSHTMPVPQSSSVFASIKTKICSLFFDEEKKNGSDSSSTNTSNHSRNSGKDDDSDLIERLIE